MAKHVRLTDEKLPEYIVNACIELRDQIDEKDGFEPDPDWHPDLDDVLMWLAAFRKGENYRRLRQKDLGSIAKLLKKASPETRAEVMKKLGIN